MAAEPDYLEAAFDVIERDHGSVQAYAAATLGMSDAGIAAIRARLLEP